MAAPLVPPMPAPAPAFYNLSLAPPSSISASVAGAFSGRPKTQEICISRGTRLEILRPDPATGRVEAVFEQEVFGTVRSLMSFRLTGASKGACLALSASWHLWFYRLPLAAR